MSQRTISRGVVEALNDAPEKVNEDPYGDGWMIAVEMSGEASELLTAGEYEEHVSE
jgi:glycine cleavage system H protein